MSGSFRPALALLCACLAACVTRAAEPAAPSIQLDPGFTLPDAPAQLDDAVDVELRLQQRSHDDLPDGAPSVVVHAPAGLQPDDATVVIYLHGWGGCARAIAYTGRVPCIVGEEPLAAWGMATRHDRAGTNTVLVVPQLPYRKNGGNPGRFRDPAFTDAWFAELTATALAPLGVDDVQDVVIVAHSGGYLTALAMLDSGLPVRSVVLFDALYGGGDRLADWLLEEPGRTAVSLHTPHPSTTGQSHLVARRVAAELGPDAVALDPTDLPDAVAHHVAIVAASPHSHNWVPAGHIEQVLPALGLGERGDGLADR